jgi:hypothetical protein
MRYAYEITGAMPDIARFFRAVEQTEFWADISFLKVDQGAGPLQAGSARRVASLTISLFSALPAEADPDGS